MIERIKLSIVSMALVLMSAVLPLDASAQVDGWGVFSENDCPIAWPGGEYAIEPLISHNNVDYRIVSINPPEVIAVYRPDRVTDRLPYPGSYVLPNLVTYKEVNYKVIGIGPCCFDAATKSVELPQSLVYISRSGVSKLDATQVVIPSGLRFIGPDNFSEMKNVTELDIPGSVISIGDRSFSDNHYVTSLKLNEGLQEIGERCFVDNYRLKEVILPFSLQNLGHGSFSGCTRLEKVRMPRWLRQTTDGWFNGCPNIKEIELTDPYCVDLPFECFKDVDKSRCVVIIPDATKDEIIPDNGFRYVRKSVWEAQENGNAELKEFPYAGLEDGFYTLSGLRIDDVEALGVGEYYISVTSGKPTKRIR